MVQLPAREQKRREIVVFEVATISEEKLVQELFD